MFTYRSTKSFFRLIDERVCRRSNEGSTTVGPKEKVNFGMLFGSVNPSERLATKQSRQRIQAVYNLYRGIVSFGWLIAA
jgi:hypothetical protein